MRPSPFFKSALRVLPFAFVGLLVSACNQDTSWDREFSCSGQERATTHLEGHPDSENYAKLYPLAVDFHIRSGAALFKSHQLAPDGGTPQLLAFSVKGPSAMISARYEPASGALTTQEDQRLTVDGVVQETHIAGVYRCQSVGTV
jgi:hypothetical protein